MELQQTAAEEAETQNWSRNDGVVAQKVPVPGTFLRRVSLCTHEGWWHLQDPRAAGWTGARWPNPGSGHRTGCI